MIEEVVHHAKDPYGVSDVYRLRRYGRTVATFRPSDGQEEKIQAGKGRIRVFEDQLTAEADTPRWPFGGNSPFQGVIFPWYVNYNVRGRKGQISIPVQGSKWFANDVYEVTKADPRFRNVRLAETPTTGARITEPATEMAGAFGAACRMRSFRQPNGTMIQTHELYPDPEGASPDDVIVYTAVQLPSTPADALQHAIECAPQAVVRAGLNVAEQGATAATMIMTPFGMQVPYIWDNSLLFKTRLRTTTQGLPATQVARPRKPLYEQGTTTQRADIPSRPVWRR